MVASKLQKGFNRVIELAGVPVRIIYFNEVIDSVYDDDISLTVSGNSFTSGVILPVNSSRGSDDSILMEQGKVQESDTKLYLSGNIVLTGSENQIRIQLGSNSGESYSLISPGPINPGVENINVYKKAYIRRLSTGSLLGE